jgi:hypothetical protein
LSRETSALAEIADFSRNPKPPPLGSGAFTVRTGVLMAAALLLLFFWFLSGFSIGGAYTPAVLALFGATVTSFVQAWRRRKQTVA